MSGPIAYDYPRLLADACRQIATLTAQLAAAREDAGLLSTCISRHEALDDEHRTAILDLIGDAELAADNPSWRRVIEAIAGKIAAARQGERERCAVRIDAMVRLCAPTERAAATVLREVAAAIRAEVKP